MRKKIVIPILVSQIIYKSILLLYICIYNYAQDFREQKKNDENILEKEKDIFLKKKSKSNYFFIERITNMRYYTYGVNIGLGYLALFRRIFPVGDGFMHRGCGLPLFKSFGFVFRANKILLSKPTICYNFNSYQKIKRYLYRTYSIDLGLWCHRNRELDNIEASTINLVFLYGLSWVYKKYVSKTIYRIEGGIMIGPNLSFAPQNFVSKNILPDGDLNLDIYNEICRKNTCLSIFFDLVIKIPIIRIITISGKVFELGWLITNFISYREHGEYDGRLKFKNPLSRKLAHIWQIYFNYNIIKKNGHKKV